MFYYLLYNSSFSFIVESRLFSTILYGSILYILTHAVLNYCNAAILNIINHYYWTLFSLDIISFSYSIYQSIINGGDIINGGNGESTGANNLNVSFNLLKNKINTMLDRKNDLTITHIPTNIPNQKNSVSNMSSVKPQGSQGLQQNAAKYKQRSGGNGGGSGNGNSNGDNIGIDEDFSDLLNLQTSPSSSNKLSTPISQLKNIKRGQSNRQSSNQLNNKSSTPISLIRNNVNIVEPFIHDNQDNQDNQDILDSLDNQDNQDSQDNSQYAASVAGSDVGSIMDLDDFETTL